MKIIFTLLIVNLLGLAGLAWYVGRQPLSDKKGFILNEQVFTRYKGTEALKKKLALLRQQHRPSLVGPDSLSENGARFPESRPDLEQQYALEEQARSDQYTAELWQKINGHMAEFGRKEGYDFIFGATGDGNLMYAGDAHNVTEDFIQYLNEKYDGN